MSHCCDAENHHEHDEHTTPAKPLESGLAKAYKAERAIAVEEAAAAQTVSENVELVCAGYPFPPKGVVVIQFKEPMSNTVRAYLSDEIAKTLARAKSKCEVLIAGPEINVYMLPPKAMDELGWVRRRVSRWQFWRRAT